MSDINEEIVLDVITVNRSIPQMYTFDIIDLIDYSEDVNLNNEIKYISKIMLAKSIRNKGIGTKILSDLCKSVGDDKFLMVTAGALIEEYDVEPTNEEYKVILKKLDKFFTNVGFIDVNNLVGEYECKCTYLYGNKVALDFIKSFEH